MDTAQWLTFAKRLNALAQNGLTYAESEYDKERYDEIYSISVAMMADGFNVSNEEMLKYLPKEIGYQTPKVDVRAVVVNEQGQLLMVQEKLDENRWALPGGWGDVGFTPFEVAVKEVQEETGLEVEAVKLLAVFDKKKHNHPYQPWYVYKLFIQCRVIGGTLMESTMETAGTSWINRSDLETLPISLDRNVLSQIQTVLDLALDPESRTLCD